MMISMMILKILMKRMLIPMVERRLISEDYSSEIAFVLLAECCELLLPDAYVVASKLPENLELDHNRISRWLEVWKREMSNRQLLFILKVHIMDRLTLHFASHFYDREDTNHPFSTSLTHSL